MKSRGIQSPPVLPAAEAAEATEGPGLNRVTSNVPGPREVQEAVGLLSKGIKQPRVEVDKFYLALQREPPHLWVVQAKKVVATAYADIKGRLLPSVRGGKSYWGHPAHTCQLLKGGAEWADSYPTMPNTCAAGRCPAGGGAGARFFYPEHDEEISALIAWGDSVEGEAGTGGPAWLKGHWEKAHRGPVVNEPLGNIGPEVAVIESGGGKRIRLAAASQKLFKATALQVAASGHPMLAHLQ